MKAAKGTRWRLTARGTFWTVTDRWTGAGGVVWVRLVSESGNASRNEVAKTVEAEWIIGDETSRAEAPLPNGLRVGDVFRYTSDRHNRWCREGIAIVQEAWRAGWPPRIIDTYWGGRGEDHVLTPAELESAEPVMFNVGDYRALEGSGASLEWARYAPADRVSYTEQHGHIVRWFVRHGATPDAATILANARHDLEVAEEKARSAADTVTWRRREVERLEAEMNAGGGTP